MTMTIREQLKKAYENLPDGAKKIAAEIHGVSIARFKIIVDGNTKDETKLHQALQAIKQASLRVLKKVEQQNKTVQDA